jgi:hypothetical protein
MGETHVSVVNPGSSEVKVWACNANDRFLKDLTPAGNRIPLTDIENVLPGNREQVRLYVYGYNHDYGCGILSGPFDTTGATDEIP